MTDRELLEKAAKANGRLWYWWDAPFRPIIAMKETDASPVVEWNPLENDAQAFRLAVKLRMHIHIHEGDVAIDDREGNGATWQKLSECADLEEATRRAIVRAAATIGDAG